MPLYQKQRVHLVYQHGFMRNRVAYNLIASNFVYSVDKFFIGIRNWLRVFTVDFPELAATIFDPGSYITRPFESAPRYKLKSAPSPSKTGLS